MQYTCLGKSIAMDQYQSGLRESNAENSPLTTKAGKWPESSLNQWILFIGDDNCDLEGMVEQLVKRMSGEGLEIASQNVNVQNVSVHRIRPVDTDPSLTLTLPYGSGQYDLVICYQISTFIDLQAEALAEVTRIVRPEGHVIIIDYLVPGSRLRGKKADQLLQACHYFNIWTSLWNPRHQRYLDMDAWVQGLEDRHSDIVHISTRESELDFDGWSGKQPLTVVNRTRLRAMLRQAPKKVSAFLTSVRLGDRIAFRLTEGFFLAATPSETL